MGVYLRQLYFDLYAGSGIGSIDLSPSVPLDRNKVLGCTQELFREISDTGTIQAEYLYPYEISDDL